MKFECKNCGSPNCEEKDGKYVCTYCGAEYPIPKSATTSQATTTTYQSPPRTARPYTPPKPLRSTRSWIVTLILTILFGWLGVHRFYAGKIGTGIIWLLTCGVFCIGWIGDIILVATGKFKDKKEYPILREKS